MGSGRIGIAAPTDAIGLRYHNRAIPMNGSGQVPYCTHHAEGPLKHPVGYSH